MVTLKIMNDARASRSYAAWQYLDLAREAVRELFGVERVFGGWSMGYYEFSTTSWPQDRTDSKYEVYIDFNEHKISVKEVTR